MKKILVGILISLVIIILAFISKTLLFSATPNFLRNNKVGGVKMEAIIGKDPRKPIIKTYLKENYLKLSQKDKEKIEEKTAGKIEGDIPCIDLNVDKNIYFKFFKDGQDIDCDRTPEIELLVSPSAPEDKTGKTTITRSLEENGYGNYSFEMNRFKTQYEKYFMEYSFIKVSYQISGVDYISFFSVNTSNVLDGTDFFKNQELDKPIESDFKN